jgi:hypothetical protein
MSLFKIKAHMKNGPFITKSDIELSGAQVGQVLAYNGTKYVPTTISTPPADVLTLLPTTNSVVLDFTLNRMFTIDLTNVVGPMFTLDYTNLILGQEYYIALIQPATPLTLGLAPNKFVTTSGATPLLTAVAGAKDLLACIALEEDKLVVSLKPDIR